MRTPNKLTDADRVKFFGLGFALILLALWGGAWLVNVCSSLYDFAAVMTAMLVLAGGVILLAIATYPEDNW